MNYETLCMHMWVQLQVCIISHKHVWLIQRVFT